MSVVVELDSIARSYPGPPETTALQTCNLVVNEGDFVTVVGPSGSGKSTLLNIVGLLDRPTAGRYLLHGIDAAVANEKRRAYLRGNHIGFVFQSFQLLEGRTSVDNVMLADLYTGGRESSSRAAATTALESVGLGTRLVSMPGELSGGERQRVAIARALAGQPSILLCDEPTGNLDSRNAAAILDLFYALNAAGTTILLITHDQEIARIGNRAVAILDGHLTEYEHMVRS